MQPNVIRRLLNWTNRLAVWGDETLMEFLREIYGYDPDIGYLMEKRDKIKRDIYSWFCSLDSANTQRLANLINEYTADQWWLNYAEIKGETK